MKKQSKELDDIDNYYGAISASMGIAMLIYILLFDVAIVFFFDEDTVINNVYVVIGLGILCLICCIYYLVGHRFKRIEKQFNNLSNSNQNLLSNLGWWVVVFIFISPFLLV